MMISEVITQLERLRAEHGEIDVECWPYDGQYRPGPAEEIRVYEEADGRIKTVPKFKELSDGTKIVDGYTIDYVTQGPVKKRAVIE